MLVQVFTGGLRLRFPMFKMIGAHDRLHNHPFHCAFCPLLLRIAAALYKKPTVHKLSDTACKSVNVCKSPLVRIHGHMVVVTLDILGNTGAVTAFMDDSLNLILVKLFL